MLKGLGNLAGMADMLKKAMEMKKRMEEVKETLGQERVEASAGAGMVKVVMTGKMELVSLEIEPELINPAEKEVLETMVRAAVNEGVARANALVKERMKELAGGLDIPGLTD